MKKLLPLLLLLATSTANATVLVDKTSHTYDCSGSSTYAIDFPFLDADDIVVTRWADASPAVITTLVQNAVVDPSYTVTVVGGGASGTVTLTYGTTCTAGFNLKIERVMDLTQEISFRSQGSYLPRTHEYMGDKLTMLIQQLDDGIALSSEATTSINNHIGSDDDHLNYLYLPGRSGGQIAYGGLLDGDELTLYNADGVQTYGYINFYAGTGLMTWGNDAGVDPVLSIDGNLSLAASHYASAPTSRFNTVYGNGTLELKGDHDTSNGLVTVGKSAEIYVDETNSRVAINSASPQVDLDVDGTVRVQHGIHIVGNGETTYLDTNEAVVVDSGDVRIDEDLTVRELIYGGTAADSAADLYIYSTRHATKGKIIVGNTTGLTVVETTGLVGVGTTTPTSTLTVQGTIAGRSEQGSITSYTLDDTKDCGTYLTDGTNGGTLTLPDRDSGNDGCVIHLINTAAAGTAQINIDPTAGNSIWGNCNGVSFSGTAGNKAQNTLATQLLGDRIGLVATGSKAWWIVECEGVWASVP